MSWIVQQGKYHCPEMLALFFLVQPTVVVMTKIWPTFEPSVSEPVIRRVFDPMLEILGLFSGFSIKLEICKEFDRQKSAISHISRLKLFFEI